MASAALAAHRQMRCRLARRFYTVVTSTARAENLGVIHTGRGLKCRRIVAIYTGRR